MATTPTTDPVNPKGRGFLTIPMKDASPTACTGSAAASAATGGFCGAEECISHGICDALHPAVAFDPSGNIGVTWHDRRDGQFEIYSRILSSRIDPTKISIADGYAFDPATRRIINMTCSGFTSGSNATDTSTALVTQSGGRLDINASARVLVLTAAQGSVDFSTLKITTGASVQILNGSNAGQTFTVSRIVAPTVAELLYVSTAVADTDFTYSISAAPTGLSSAEIRLTCNPTSSMFPDIVADSQGRFHIVFQDNATGNFELYYIQMYPSTVGKAKCTGTNAPINVLGFAPVTSAGANTITITNSVGVQTTYQATGSNGSFFSFGNKLQPDPMPLLGGPVASRTGLHKIFKDSTNNEKWTGVSLADDRLTWEQQAATLPEQVQTPPYVASVGNPIADPGDFGTNDFGAAFQQIAFIAQTPPDMGVEIRRVALPLRPYCVPDMPASAANMTPSLVEAPKKPLPPTFVDPVNLNEVLTSPLTSTDNLPSRFTVEGDSSGTIFTNILVDEGRGQLNRLVFDCTGGKKTQDQLAFILGQRKCGEELCALPANSKSPAGTSSQYKIRLEVWQGADYRGDGTIPASMIGASKLIEREFTFSPGSSITAFDFKERELLCPSGRYLFFVPQALQGVQFYVEGVGNGHAVWTTNDLEGDQNRFDQYIVPYTIPPNSGIDAPVYYEGVLRTEPPAISSVLAVGASVGETFSYSITGTNSPTSFDATGLPAGLVIDTASGIISGTPTTIGNYTVEIGASNVNGRGTANLTIVVTNLPLITSVLTATGDVGKAFTYTITAKGSPTSFSADALPAGLSLDTQTGIISGTPASVAESDIVITATNANGSGSATLVITIGTVPTVPDSVITSVELGDVVNTFQPDTDQDWGNTSFSADGVIGTTNPTTGRPPTCPSGKLPNGTRVLKIKGTNLPKANRFFRTGSTSSTTPFYTINQNGAGFRISSTIFASFTLNCLAQTYPVKVVNGICLTNTSTEMYVLLPGSIVEASLALAITKYPSENSSVADSTSSFTIGASGVGSFAVSGTDCSNPPPPPPPPPPPDGGDTGGNGDNTDPVVTCDGKCYVALPSIRLTNSVGDSVHPRLAIDSKDLIWLVFHSNRSGTDEVYVGQYFCGKWATSARGGADFQLTKAGENGKWARFPNIAVDELSDAHVVWHSNDTEDNLPEIFYSKTTGDSKTFAAQRRITASPAQAMMPDIVVSKSSQGQGGAGAEAGNCPTTDTTATAPQQTEGKVFVVWHDNRFNQFEIMAATRSGGIWESSGEGRSDIRVTQASEDSLFPRLATDSKGNVRAVYHDYRRSQDNPWIFMSSYIAATNRWDSTGQGGTDLAISPTGTGHSLHADIAIDVTDGVYVVWHDDRFNTVSSDSGYQIMGAYCAKGGAPLAICVPICTNTESYLQTDFAITDPVQGLEIEATNIPNVNLVISSPGAMYYRIIQDDGTPSPWLPFRPGASLDTMVVPYVLTGGTGMKKVCIQVQDSTTVGFPVCNTIMLQAGIPSFQIAFFKDEAMAIPLETYNSIPVSPEGDVFVRLTSAVPLIFPPTFDVLNRGTRLVFNQKTMAMSGFSGFSGASNALGQVVSQGSIAGFSAYAGTVFQGRMHVYRDDGFFHLDGPARLVPHGKDIFGQVF